MPSLDPPLVYLVVMSNQLRFSKNPTNLKFLGFWNPKSNCPFFKFQNLKFCTAHFSYKIITSEGMIFVFSFKFWISSKFTLLLVLLHFKSLYINMVAQYNKCIFYCCFTNLIKPFGQTWAKNTWKSCQAPYNLCQTKQNQIEKRNISKIWSATAERQIESEKRNPEPSNYTSAVSLFLMTILILRADVKYTICLPKEKLLYVIKK